MTFEDEYKFRLDTSPTPEYAEVIIRISNKELVVHKVILDPIDMIMNYEERNRDLIGRVKSISFNVGFTALANDKGQFYLLNKKKEQ